jgi:hypothetical protein
VRLEFSMFVSGDRPVEFRPSSVPLQPNHWKPTPPFVLKQYWEYIDASEQRIDRTVREVDGDPDDNKFRLGFNFGTNAKSWTLEDAILLADGEFAVINGRARLRFAIPPDMLPTGSGRMCIEVKPVWHEAKLGRSAHHPPPPPNAATTPLLGPTEDLLLWWMGGNPQAQLTNYQFVEALDYRDVKLELVGRHQPKD